MNKHFIKYYISRIISGNFILYYNDHVTIKYNTVFQCISMKSYIVYYIVYYIV